MPKEPMRTAVLDDNNVLVDVKMIKYPTKKHLDAGDLPADGSYFWSADQQTFIPVGFGNGKPKAPETSRDHALFLFMRAVIDGKPIPKECRDWCDWYAKHHGVR